MPSSHSSTHNTMTRRRFFVTSAAMAAAAGAGKAYAANETIRVAVIGCRNRGPQVGKVMQKAGGFQIVAACDCDRRMLTKGVRELRGEDGESPAGVTDFRTLLDNPEVDAVVVATPDHWHACMTVMALDAGKHVFLEKPASFNIRDGQAMVAAQAVHPELVVQVGTQQRSGAHFEEARQYIAEGNIGAVAFCRGSFCTHRAEVPIVPDGAPPAHLDYDLWCGPAPMRPYNEELLHYNWHYLYDYGTGDMGNWGAHWLDAMRFMVGLDLPVSVSGYGQDIVPDAKEWPDTQTVMYQFPGCTMVWEQRHWSTFGPGGGAKNCCEIVGSKGAILIDRGGWTTHEKAGDYKPSRNRGSDLETPHVRSFAQAIREGGRPNTPIEEGHKSAILCHLGNIATRLGRSVAFDPAAERITGDGEAAAMMGREDRAPWSLGEYA